MRGRQVPRVKRCFSVDKKYNFMIKYIRVKLKRSGCGMPAIAFSFYDEDKEASMKQFCKIWLLAFAVVLLLLTVSCGKQEAGETAAETAYCTLTVRCDSLLKHPDLLSPEKRELVPDSGVLYPSEQVAIAEGDTVFDVLCRELKRNYIHFEYKNTGLAQDAFILGIGNLYAGDAGEFSGWMYTVNGESPDKGCAQYAVSKGDQIVWTYTCEMEDSEEAE